MEGIEGKEPGRRVASRIAPQQPNETTVYFLDRREVDRVVRRHSPTRGNLVEDVIVHLLPGANTSAG